jgi:hypothetical protein
MKADGNGAEKHLKVPIQIRVAGTSNFLGTRGMGSQSFWEQLENFVCTLPVVTVNWDTGREISPI